MKILIRCLAMLFLLHVPTTFPAVTVEFASWRELIETSPQIVVVACTKAPDLYSDTFGVYNAEIDVKYILKGTTNSSFSELPHAGSGRLLSMLNPIQGRLYAVFSFRLEDKQYKAIEPYRIIQLSRDFSVDMLRGKTLNEQVRAILRDRLDELDKQTNRPPGTDEEKRRLESGLRP